MVAAVVLSVREVAGDTGSYDRDTTREYTRNFHVRVSSPVGAYNAIVTHPLIPKRYQAHPEDSQAYCVRLTPTRRTGYFPPLFDVAAEYTSKLDEEQDENPLERPAEIEWEDVDYQEPSETDIDGKAVLNTAGDPFIPPLELDKSRWIISVSRNLAAAPKWLLSYSNAINSDSVKIQGIQFKPRQLKLKGLRIGKFQIENDVKFLVVKFKLHTAETWITKRLNRGFNELVAMPTGELDESGQPILEARKQRILLDDGEPPSDPQFLDENGVRILPEDFDPDNVVELEFKTAKELPFAKLLK